MNRKKLFKKVIAGSGNVPFTDLTAVVKTFGFRLDRVRGSHHIFIHDGIRELLNLQDCKGKAKPYQIRQFLALVEQYDLNMEGEE
jgi:HicA toxin of bacterial toxin-antitoxin,